jgi:pimeloyl-ACP methyl ester carboxylesterase
MSKTTSKDGTAIAYEKSGNGPAVILVDGALCYRKLGPMGSIARELAAGFTVLTYDRRGRGESGDTAPYSVEREVDDIEALIEVTGGSAFIYGASSGAALALAAASRLEGIRKLALYEAPFIVDGSQAPQPADYPSKMSGFTAADRRGDAVKLFMKAVGVPAIVVAMMPLMPDCPNSRPRRIHCLTMWQSWETHGPANPYRLSAGQPSQFPRWWVSAGTAPSPCGTRCGRSPTYSPLHGCTFWTVKRTW